MPSPRELEPRPSDAESDEDQPQWRGPSRSQKKRDARAVHDLGVLMSKLPPAALRALPLDEEILEALLLSKSLKRTALARQMRRIAKLLRGLDLEPLYKVLRERRLLR